MANQTLESNYPFVFMDTVDFKGEGKHIVNKIDNVILGVNLEGCAVDCS